MGLILNFQEVKKIPKGIKKNSTCYKRAFLSLFLQQQKTVKFWENFKKKKFELCSKSKKNKLLMIYKKAKNDESQVG